MVVDELVMPSGRDFDLLGFGFFLLDVVPNDIEGAFNRGVSTSIDGDDVERTPGLFNVEEDVLFH